MSFRIFKGNVVSLNGWRMCNDDECEWYVVPGTENNPDGPVNLQIRKGIPATILLAFAARFNQVIETLRDADSACWTLNNDVDTSNHPAGVACDFNWQSHPFHAYGTFGNLLDALRHLLDVEFRGCVGWGGDWGGNPQDEMHFEIRWQEGYVDDGGIFHLDVDPRLVALANDLAGGNVQPSPPVNTASDAVTTLYDAVPVIDETRAAELVDAVRAGLAAAQCTTVNRIAMYLAQCGHESDGFATTEEYATGADYENNAQLGNTQPGDGVRFKGRSWIQITGRSNYQAFSQWAYDTGITTDQAYFVNNPAALAQLQYAGVGAAWYWTVARPDINALSDAGDVDTVTRRINGGTTGITDRRNRYQQAIALGDRLLTLIAPTTEGPLMALTDDEQQELLTKTREVWDQLRGPTGEGWPQLQGLTPVDTLGQVQASIQGLLSSSTAGFAVGIAAAFDKLQQQIDALK